MEIWKPPAPRETVFGMIGRHFRTFILSRDPMALSRRASICGMCQEPTEPGRRRWAPAFRSYVDNECIPAIVRRRGEAAIVDWLETGELMSGPASHRAMVSWQTITRT